VWGKKGTKKPPGVEERRGARRASHRDDRDGQKKLQGGTLRIRRKKPEPTWEEKKDSPKWQDTTGKCRRFKILAWIRRVEVEEDRAAGMYSDGTSQEKNKMDHQGGIGDR